MSFQVRQRKIRVVKETLLIGGGFLFLAVLVFMIARYWNDGNTLETLTDSFAKAGEFVKEDVQVLAPVAWAEEGDGYTLSDDLSSGISIVSSGEEETASKNPLKLTFSKKYTTPLEVTLGENKIIHVTDKSATDGYASKLISQEKIMAENGQSQSWWQKLFTSQTKKEIQENKYVSYVSPDNRKTILYSYGRDKGLGERALKHWTFYNKGSGEEKETYQIDKAVLQVNRDGGVDVYYLDEEEMKNRPEVSGVDQSLVERASKKFTDDLRQSIAHGDVAPDMTIPKPYLVDKDGNQIALEWKVEDDKTISWEASFDKSRYPVAIDPSLIFVAKSTNSGGAVITGEPGAGHLGAVMAAGDFNADGRTDLAAAAPNYSTNTGRIYIFYNDGNITTAAGLSDVSITGGATSDFFGISLASGDFNADGTTDLAVGAEGYTTNTGRVYLFYNDGAYPTTVTGADTSLTGGATSDKFGHSLVAGDFNANGTVDIAIGANGKSSSAGGVYIYYNDGSYTTADITITGNAASDAFGGAIASGDVNADSKTDLVVGATGYNPGAAANTGRSYIFYNDGSIPTTANTADVFIVGNAASDLFGTAITTGDLNNDGKIDIAISSSGYTTSTGRVYIFNNDGSIPTTAATADVTITGETTSNSFGIALATGDMNDDKKIDLIVGASGYTTSTGRIYLFFNDGSIPTTAATADVIVTGESTSDQLGYALAVGDFNSDGKVDFAGDGYGFSGADGNGRVYLFYSQNGQVATNRILTGENINQYFGCSFAKGDFNSDGRIDLAVGAKGYSSDAGLVYLFYNDGTLPTGAASADMTISGTSASDLFGISMTPGDFNADGRTDLAIGGRGYSTNTGRAYIFYNDGSIPTAAASADVIITGETTTNYFGGALGTGDMNTDNRDDLIVGAEQYSTATGRVYVFLNDGSIPTTAATADVTFTGVATSNRFGASIAVGDYDNTGTDDLFIGAPQRTTNTGRVYLFRNTTATIDTTSDDTITGASSGDLLGTSMVTGDYDDDGDIDIAFSSYGFTAGANTGRVYIFYNVETGVFPTLANANVIISGEANARFGYALASGDVNADGRTDLIVGGFGFSSSAGRAYIFYNDGSYPTTAITADVIINGDTASGIFGNTLVTYDTTGDGKEDVMVGAEGYSTNTGRIYFYETKVNFNWKLQAQIGRNIRINNNLSGEEQIVTGEWGASNTFGSKVIVGDMNADGKLDLVASAPAYNSSMGRVYIFYSDTRLTPNASGAEAVIAGGATSDLFGSALAVGDYNTDGKSDLAVGAPGYSSSTGRAYIFYGDGRIPDSTATADITITGNAAGDLFGTALAAGDVNNSGDTDLIVGAPDYLTTQGRVYVYYNDGSIPVTAALADVTITGNASNDAFGAALASKDFSNDGKADIAVGAYGYTTNTGRVYVFNGDGTIPTTAATADVTITGNASGDRFGDALTGVDLNRNGGGDVIVGAYAYSSSTGRVYVFYGDGTMPTTAATADITITGATAGDNFGKSLAAGDVNTDSFPDLMVGATGYSSSTGRAYIFYNDGSIPTTAATADATLTGETTSSGYGGSIGIGDFDADGKTDVIVGSSTYVVNTFNVGRMYLYTFNDNVITGATAGDCFGSWLSSADLNSDGKNDLIASASCYGANAGRTYIFYADGLINSSASGTGPDVTITGESGDDFFGRYHATGDFNYDGKTDLIVSSPGYSAGGNTGRAYIFYNDGTIPTTAVTADVIITGNAASDSFGSALVAGDFNADNRMDFAVGASGYTTSTGRVYIFNNDGTIPTTAATADTTITGNATSDLFGTSLIAGDFNADSKTDLAVGASGYSSAAGRAYIFNNDGSIPTTAATADTTITGESASNFGVTLARGDMNADGKVDLVVGASTYSTSTGRVYIFNNDGSIPTTAATADTTIDGESGAYFGYRVVTGDISTDGREDLIVSNNYTSAAFGRVYVFYNDGSYPSTSATADKMVASSTENPGSALLVMDINLDGKLDIVTSETSYSSSKGAVYSYVSETSYIPLVPTSAIFRGDVIMRGDNTVR